MNKKSIVEVKLTLQLTVGQSVSMSWYRAHSGTCDQILLSVRRLFSETCCLVFLARPLSREVGSVICKSQSSHLSVEAVKSKSHYNWRSASQYVRVSSPLWDLWPEITFCPKVVFSKLLSFLCGAPSLTRGRVCHLSISVVIYQYLHPKFTLHVFYSWGIYTQYV
jgi:hypothetical protein